MAANGIQFMKAHGNIPLGAPKDFVTDVMLGKGPPPRISGPALLEVMNGPTGGLDGKPGAQNFQPTA
jgi:hypothetical protein